MWRCWPHSFRSECGPGSLNVLGLPEARRRHVFTSKVCVNSSQATCFQGSPAGRQKAGITASEQRNQWWELLLRKPQPAAALCQLYIPSWELVAKFNTKDGHSIFKKKKKKMRLQKDSLPWSYPGPQYCFSWRAKCVPRCMRVKKNITKITFLYPSSIKQSCFQFSEFSHVHIPDKMKHSRHTKNCDPVLTLSGSERLPPFHL